MTQNIFFVYSTGWVGVKEINMVWVRNKAFQTGWHVLQTSPGNKRPLNFNPQGDDLSVDRKASFQIRNVFGSKKKILAGKNNISFIPHYSDVQENVQICPEQ